MGPGRRRSSAIALGLLRWATTTYRVTPTQVEVRRGLLGKSVLTVPRDRVRSVDLTSHFMHRLLGLTRVAIGTGQTDRKPRQRPRRSTACPAADGARLRDELLRRARPASPAAVNGLRRPTAGAGAGRAARESVLGPARPGLDPVRAVHPVRAGHHRRGGRVRLAHHQRDRRRPRPDRRACTTPTTAAVRRADRDRRRSRSPSSDRCVVAVFSTVGYVLAFWNFRLTRSSHGTLHVTRGLITTRSTTIEERRLRGVEFSEPLLLRAVGGARAIAITTGLRVGRGAERGGSILLPPAPAGRGPAGRRRGAGRRGAGDHAAGAPPAGGPAPPADPGAGRPGWCWSGLAGLVLVAGRSDVDSCGWRGGTATAADRCSRWTATAASATPWWTGGSCSGWARWSGADT